METSTCSDPDESSDTEWQRTKVSRMRDSLEQEGTFLRVPLKHYKNMIKANQHDINAYISGVIDAVTETAQCDISLEDSVEILTSIISGLKACKRVLGESVFNKQARRFMARLDHIDSANLNNMAVWNKIRMNRILVDYMLRMSYHDTASKLTETSIIEEIVDIKEFDEARMVISALQNKEVAPALAWCHDNKSGLKKYKGKKRKVGLKAAIKQCHNHFALMWMLLVNLYAKANLLRLQEFIELVRADSHLHAMEYAQKYLAPWGTTHMKDLKRVLFEPRQWDFLVDQFKQEFYKLYSMTFEPLLCIYLQAGLCALKTPFSYEDDCTKEDPLSQESFHILAAPLPFSMQYPIFINYITGEQMGPKQTCQLTSMDKSTDPRLF